MQAIGTYTQPAAPQPWSNAPLPRLELRYVGTGGGLFFVVAKNLLLTLVTLGIYLPWARTERRKYLCQNIEVGGSGTQLGFVGTMIMGRTDIVAAAIRRWVIVPWEESKYIKPIGSVYLFMLLSITSGQ